MTRSYPRGLPGLPPKPEPLWLEDPVAGIVPGIYEVEVPPGNPDVFVCAARVADLRLYGLDHRASSSGSGAGLAFDAAYMAAVGECAERYALAVPASETLTFGTYEQLTSGPLPVIAPERWALFDTAQHGRLPYPAFGPRTPLAWATAQNLHRQEECLVPACLTFLPYAPAFTERGEQVIAPTISTGAACGPNLPHALYRGLCELVERDAVMISWRNRLPCPRLEIDPDSRLHALFRERFDRPGLRYHLAYTTLDLGVHSVMGLLIDESASPPGFVAGGAAHLDPHAAALKTLLELVQGLSWMDDLRQQPLEPEPGFRNVQSFKDRARLYANQPPLREAVRFLLESERTVKLSELEDLSTGTPRGDLRRCMELLGRRGLEVLAVERTTPDLEACGLYVVKVMVPELETMEGDSRLPFLGGQRWRQVPVRLGLRERPLELSELNPYPHPYP